MLSTSMKYDQPSENEIDPINYLSIIIVHLHILVLP